MFIDDLLFENGDFQIECYSITIYCIASVSLCGVWCVNYCCLLSGAVTPMGMKCTRTGFCLYFGCEQMMHDGGQ